MSEPALQPGYQKGDHSRKRGTGHLPWWETEADEQAIYELTLKQIYAMLSKPSLDKQTRTRLLLAVLRWQGKLESSGEKSKAFGQLVALSRGAGEPDESDALPADAADQDQGTGSDPVPTELGPEQGRI